MYLEPIAFWNKTDYSVCFSSDLALYWKFETGQHKFTSYSNRYIMYFTCASWDRFQRYGNFGPIMSVWIFVQMLTLRICSFSWSMCIVCSVHTAWTMIKVNPLEMKKCVQSNACLPLIFTHFYLFLQFSTQLINWIWIIEV